MLKNLVISPMRFVVVKKRFRSTEMEIAQKNVFYSWHFGK